MNFEQEQKLNAAALNDPYYLSLLERCRALEPEYLRIRCSLPEEDQEMLETYLSVCEEMEFRKTCFAITTAPGPHK